MADSFLVLIVFYYVTTLGFVCQAFMLALQVRAYFRNKHVSFALLAAATVLGVIYLILMIVPNFLRPTERMALQLYIASACFVTLQVALSLWGTISLFNSYGVLAKAKRTAAELSR